MQSQDYRHNFTALTLDGVFFFLGMIFISIETVLPLLLNRLGASSIAIAALPVGVVLGVNIPSIFVAAHIESLDRKLPYTVRVGVLQRLPWAVVGLLIPFLAVPAPGAMVFLVIAATYVTTMAAGCTIPAFFDIISTTIPVEQRGTLGALRSILSYLAGIGGGVAVRVVLDRVSFPLNYTWLFMIATILLFIGLGIVSRVREPARSGARSTTRSIPQRIRYALGSSRSFRLYIVMRGILVVSFATTGFFPVYLAERFGLTDGVAGLFSIITAVVFVAVNPVFGRLGNRIGYKPMFIASFVSLMASGVIGLLNVDLPFAYLLIALAAVSRSVELLSFNMTIEFAPPGRVPSFIGVSGLFIGLVAPLGLLVGVVVDRLGYGALFGITLVTAAVGLVVLTRVHEPRRAYQLLNRPDIPG